MTAARRAQARVQARTLAATGRANDAVAVLKAAGDLDAALDVRRDQVRERPDSMVARHNLASVLGDLGYVVEAETEARAALALGGDAPETWLVLARALLGQDRHDDAQAAYGQVLRRRPLDLAAVRELGQLIWMRTEDRDLALAPIERALAMAPAAGPLHAARAQMMSYAGGSPETIWDALTAAPVNDIEVAVAAVHAALAFDAEMGLQRIEQLSAAARQEPRVVLKEAEARLAAGQADVAASLCRRMLEQVSFDQNALSLLAVAARQLGSPEAGVLNDYETLVQSYRIDTPDGWTSLTAYLADLAAALRRMHSLKSHPIGQSLRHGTQTNVRLSASDDTAIMAFFQAIDGPIRAHLDHLGRGDDPVRGRNTGAYRIAGSWSVQLRPGGYHAAHVHPEGWLSSACYIDLPPAIDKGCAREGWIAFGAPPFLKHVHPQHFERPEPGKLVLFPSYMWHGTEPFGGDAPRLTAAFDVVPD